jgi:hypothetical protein
MIRDADMITKSASYRVVERLAGYLTLSLGSSYLKRRSASMARRASEVWRGSASRGLFKRMIAAYARILRTVAASSAASHAVRTVKKSVTYSFLKTRI